MADLQERKLKDAQMRATINQKLVETGERERLKDLLRARLIECGWRDQLKAYCKEIVQQKGLEHITVDDLVSEITPRGRYNDLTEDADTIVHSGEEVEELKQKLNAANKIIYKLKSKDKPREEAAPVDPGTQLDILFKFLPAPSAEFFKSQILMCHREKNGRRWTEKDKTVALSLYHASPKCYSLLQKLFILPSLRTLKRTIENCDIYPGFNDTIFISTAEKVKSMSDTSKLCSVVFDEMTIKEYLSYDSKRDEIEGLEDFGGYGEKSKLPANHATVFMARGIVGNWKQPLGYFLSNGPINSSLLSTLLISCVSRLLAVGLDVKFVVADQGSNNRKAFSSLGVSELSPFFFVDEKKILVFYDPPHLLKNIRNNLKRSGFKTDSGRVEWKHVVDFYNLDRKNSVRMAPKLTDMHINLPPFSTLKVSYAAQILSHSVASGISFIGSLRNDSSASETSKFIENFDCLFNAFNSRNLHSRQKMGHALSNNSGHLLFLKEMLEWLDTVEVCSPNKIFCLSGWKLSIRSLLMLWTDLSENYKLSFFCTRKLNQDCIENLFSRIRGHCSRVDSPTALNFRSFFRNVMVDCLFSHSKGSNCKEDGETFLLSFQTLMSSMKETDGSDSNVVGNNVSGSLDSTVTRLDDNDFIEDMPSDTSDDLLNVIRSNVITYIAGYVSKKLSLKTCSYCISVLTGELSSQTDEEFLIIKKLDCFSKGLHVPSQVLKSTLKALEVKYCKIISALMPTSNVKSILFSELKDLCSLSCETCNLNKLVLNLFINIRLHFTIKDLNNLMKIKKFRRNRKVMKVKHI